MPSLSGRAKVTSLFLPAVLLGFLLVRKRGFPPQGIEVAPAGAGGPEEAAASPVAMAAGALHLDVTYLRWLWWPIILYLFWGMAYVCDEYFVRTIDVISERFQIPDDVAGATLMALGCNGPEMALNTIAIFHPSNIGVGAVIGGEVFNVLVIIGTAILATPEAYLPLKLGQFTFFRDVIFYVVSVGILYWVLRDGSISRLNTAVLLIGALCYILTVAFSSSILSFSSKVLHYVSHRRLRKLAHTTTRRLSRKITRALSMTAKPKDFLDIDDDSDWEEPAAADPAMIAQWMRSRECTDPVEGSVLGVRVDVRNRLMDRNRHMEERYVLLSDDALLVSTVVDPSKDVPLLRRTETWNAFTKKDHTWHHGGLVNQPAFVGADLGVPLKTGEDIESAPELSRPLINETNKKRITQLFGQQKPPALELDGFKQAPWEVIPLEDVLYCEPSRDQTHFALHVHQHDSELGQLITLEFSARQETVSDAWVKSVCEALRKQRRGNVEAPLRKSCIALIMEWAEWFQFPVKFFLKISIPNMDDPKLQHWYPVSFTMSMVWLAVFAYSVCCACDGIHEDFGIPVTVLGFTVAAAGTSFPNVFSGMVVAKQGKTSMAIANALGANVQNVFLALAVPWTIQAWVIAGGPFPMMVNDLFPAIIECMITLIPVVLVYVLCSSSLPWWSGGLFLLTYAAYLVFALGQQLTNCVLWPFPCVASA